MSELLEALQVAVAGVASCALAITLGWLAARALFSLLPRAVGATRGSEAR